jgi:hypothetical protein
MIGIATALWLSKPLRWAVIGLAMMASYETWKFHQQKLGAERFAANQERKANADTKQADEVRDAVATAKPFSGLRDPNRRDAGNKP